MRRSCARRPALSSSVSSCRVSLMRAALRRWTDAPASCDGCSGGGVAATEAIASAYAPEGTGSLVPGEELLEASDGIPRRVHEAASRWAARDAARRVVDIAPRAAAERSALRGVEEGLAGRLVELQEARERLDRFSDDDALVVCP